MANTNLKHVIEDGPRDYVVALTLACDGSSGEISADTLVEVSALAEVSPGKACTAVKLVAVQWSLSGADLKLSWDATAAVLFLVLSGAYGKLCFERFGGIANNSGGGKTGDVLFSTSGFTAATDLGTAVFHFRKS